MKKHDLICPVCEAGHLSSQTYSETFLYHGRTLLVDGLEGYLCDTCGADPVFEDQIRRGHLKYQDARRRTDGLLAGREIQGFRNRFGLKQKQAARIFGGGANAFSKYERGDVIQSVAMDRLIRACIRHPSLLTELAEEAGVALPGSYTECVTKEGRAINADILAGKRKSCDVVWLEDHRHKRSAVTRTLVKEDRSVESHDWEMA